jgi:hypothetical protein
LIANAERKEVPEMGKKSQRMIALAAFFFLGLLAIFPPGCLSDANQPFLMNKMSTHPMGSSRFGSSVVFPVQGNVYPIGYEV